MEPFAASVVTGSDGAPLPEEDREASDGAAAGGCASDMMAFARCSAFFANLGGAYQPNRASLHASLPSGPNFWLFTNVGVKFPQISKDHVLNQYVS